MPPKAATSFVACSIEVYEAFGEDDHAAGNIFFCRLLEESNGSSGALYHVKLPEEIMLETLRDRTKSFTVEITGSSVFKNRILCEEDCYIRLRSVERRRWLRDAPPSTGDLRLAVIRIDALDRSPSVDVETVRETLFGNETVSLTRQLGWCSAGGLRLSPYYAGIYDVSVPVFISDYSPTDFPSLIQLVSDEFDVQHPGARLPDADFIMFHVPPGTGGSWAAFGTMFGAISVFNDQWITYLAAEMHEIGHNLGLNHDYDDSTGHETTSSYMGSARGLQGEPQRCFNAANYYRLGWHRDRTVAVDSLSTRQIRLISFVDYDVSSSEDATVISIDDKLFLQYNRRASFNAGTRQNADKVLVTQAFESNRTTYLLAGLDQSAPRFVFRQAGSHSITIQICTMLTGLSSVYVVGIGRDQHVCRSEFSPSATPTMLPLNLDLDTVEKDAEVDSTPAPTLIRADVMERVLARGYPTFSPTFTPTAATSSSPTTAQYGEGTDMDSDRPDTIELILATFAFILVLMLGSWFFQRRKRRDLNRDEWWTCHDVYCVDDNGVLWLDEAYADSSAVVLDGIFLLPDEENSASVARGLAEPDDDGRLEESSDASERDLLAQGDGRWIRGPMYFL